MVVFCISTTIGCFIKYMVINFFKYETNFDMFKVDKLSGYLYIPYIMWLVFASYLNLFIVL